VAEDVTPGPKPALPAPTPQPIESDEPAAAPTVTVPTRSENARKTAFRGRFVAVYFVLAIVVGVAIGGLAVTLSSPKKHTAKPTVNVFTSSTSGELGAIDLANNVQRNYRGLAGAPFVDIVATRNTLQDGNLGLLRVRYQVIQPGDASKDRDSHILTPDDAIQYSLCGSGTACAIPGTATKLRGALLEREALELALRTFQHDGAVDNVVVFLRPFQPPQGSQFEGYVLMLSRAQVQHDEPTLLTNPIAKTLPGAGSKMTQEQMTSIQAQRIDELTKPHLYLYRYQLIGGRDAAIDLQPAAA
jgi:hypothetical protein